MYEFNIHFLLKLSRVRADSAAAFLAADVDLLKAAILDDVEEFNDIFSCFC